MFYIFFQKKKKKKKDSIIKKFLVYEVAAINENMNCNMNYSQRDVQRQ